MIKKSLILFFFLVACGYEPIHINQKEIIYKKITLIGDKQINRKIISSLSVKENSESNINNEIILETSKNINTTSKDSMGRAKTFRTNLSIKLTIISDGKIIKERLFSENFSYQNRDNKYDLFAYQDTVEDNLINKIMDNLNIFLKM